MTGVGFLQRVNIGMALALRRPHHEVVTTPQVAKPRERRAADPFSFAAGIAFGVAITFLVLGYLGVLII